jgi:hypothetical protein
MKKRKSSYLLGATFATLFLVLLLNTPVRAFDIDSDYSGVVDTYTGEAVGDNTTVSMADRVFLDTNVSYDRSNKMFIYTVTGLGSEVGISVCDGMYTTEAVRITMPVEVMYGLYRDGEQIDLTSGEAISTPGSYVLDLSPSATTTQQVRFTILSSVTGKISEYRMPSYFAASEALLNDEPISFTGGVIPMDIEGRYKITYYCQPTGVGYTLSVITDHTPPELALENVIDGVAKGPVSLEDAEPDSTLGIVLNNEPIKAKKKLTESGSYTVTITDAAGNSNIYNFRIQVYFNASAWTFLGILIGLIVIITVYIIVSRKNLRVR